VNSEGDLFATGLRLKAPSSDLYEEEEEEEEERRKEEVVNRVLAEWGSHVNEAAQLKQSSVRGISTLQRITTKEAAREEVEKSRTRRRNQRLVFTNRFISISNKLPVISIPNKLSVISIPNKLLSVVDPYLIGLLYPDPFILKQASGSSFLFIKASKKF